MFQTDGLAATYHTFEKETVFEQIKLVGEDNAKEKE